MNSIYNKRGFYIKKYSNNIFRKFWWISVIIISIGGLYYPYIGLVVPIFMVSLLVLSYFKGRYWCGNICPRGSLNDNIIKKYSLNKKTPHFFRSTYFRYGFLIFFLLLFSFRTFQVYSKFSGYDALMKMGFIFATICLFTTIIALVLGAVYSSRTWCMFCPMGTMQKEIYKRSLK